MARGRHRRRTGLLARLWPAWGGSRRSRTAALEVEVRRLRLLTEASAETAATALRRAAAAEDRAVLAERRLATALADLAGVRADLAALREELVWAFAARKVDVEVDASPAAPAVIDLRDRSASTA